MRNGFKEIYNGKSADVYLINTCTVTSVADAKSREIIRRFIKENPRGKVIVTGCLAEKDAFSLSGIKGINYVVAKRFFPVGISKFCGHTRAFLKIQDGCDNFCSYCKVPFVRGRSKSRELSEVINEAQRLAKNGYKEIVLTGICLGSYGKDLLPKKNLVDVIRPLEEIEGILRIRLSSVEAGDVSEELIDCIANSKKLCRHLHIPIQSGDDEILKLMRRKYSRVDYVNLVKKIRRHVSGIAITTDCLVGFPGETDEHFKNTLDLVRKITPLRTHIFPYSKRIGTYAAGCQEKIPQDVIKSRIEKLKRLAFCCAKKFKNKFIGREMYVLFEGRSRVKDGYWEGYTDNYIPVLFKSRRDLKNEFLRVKLKEVKEDVVFGSIS